MRQVANVRKKIRGQEEAEICNLACKPSPERVLIGCWQAAGQERN